MYKFIDSNTLATLFHAFVTSKLDYGNALLYGIPKKYLCPRGDIDRLYMKRVAGGRELQSVEDTVELRKNFGIQWKPSG